MEENKLKHNVNFNCIVVFNYRCYLSNGHQKFTENKTCQNNWVHGIYIALNIYLFIWTEIVVSC